MLVHDRSGVGFHGCSVSSRCRDRRPA
jgi:hypothetical protein